MTVKSGVLTVYVTKHVDVTIAETLTRLCETRMVEMVDQEKCARVVMKITILCVTSVEIFITSTTWQMTTALRFARLVMKGVILRPERMKNLSGVR
jgi:hypothetical protein